MEVLAAALELLVQSEPRHDLDEMILHPEVKTDILAGLRSLEIREAPVCSSTFRA